MDAAQPACAPFPTPPPAQPALSPTQQTLPAECPSQEVPHQHTHRIAFSPRSRFPPPDTAPPPQSPLVTAAIQPTHPPARRCVVDRDRPTSQEARSHLGSRDPGKVHGTTLTSPPTLDLRISPVFLNTPQEASPRKRAQWALPVAGDMWHCHWVLLQCCSLLLLQWFTWAQPPAVHCGSVRHILTLLDLSSRLQPEARRWHCVLGMDSATFRRDRSVRRPA